MKMYALMRLLLLSCTAEATVYTDSFSRVLTGQRMTGALATHTYHGISISECAVNSLKLSSTVAFNYALQTGSCEVIKDLQITTETGTVPDDNYNCYITSSVNPCEVNPCKHGGLCQVSASGNDYNCTDCPYPTTGKNCQDLSCDVDCVMVPDDDDDEEEDNVSAKVYFFYKQLGSTWIGAYEHCRSLSMDMAMIKSNATYQYVLNRLLAMYAATPDAPHCYWIGLNRSSPQTPWTWVDGTTLGAWNAWYPSSTPATPQSELCVGMPNYFYRFAWADDPCQGYPDTQYVYSPICQLGIAN